METGDYRPILVDTATLSKMLSLGVNSTIDVGEKARAKVTYGRRVLWRVDAIQQYVIDAGGSLKE